MIQFIPSFCPVNYLTCCCLKIGCDFFIISDSKGGNHSQRWLTLNILFVKRHSCKPGIVSNPEHFLENGIINKNKKWPCGKQTECQKTVFVYNPKDKRSIVRRATQKLWAIEDFNALNYRYESGKVEIINRSNNLSTMSEAVRILCLRFYS